MSWSDLPQAVKNPENVSVQSLHLGSSPRGPRRTRPHPSAYQALGPRTPLLTPPSPACGTKGGGPLPGPGRAWETDATLVPPQGGCTKSRTSGPTAHPHSPRGGGGLAPEDRLGAGAPQGANGAEASLRCVGWTWKLRLRRPRRRRLAGFSTARAPAHAAPPGLPTSLPPGARRRGGRACAAADCTFRALEVKGRLALCRAAPCACGAMERNRWCGGPSGCGGFRGG